MGKLQKYQNYYDIIHSDKKYEKEVFFLEKIIKKYSFFPIKNILSLGCGTAGHEIILAREGYNISGIDYSREMLDIARKKAKNINLKINLKLGDIRKFSFNKKFDMAISMYNVFCDLSGIGDVEKVFNNVSDVLKSGGIFAFDCWYGPAILKNKPVSKVKKINFKDRRFIQIRTSKLDAKRSFIDTKFEVFEIKNNKKEKITQKNHKAYFWYFSDIEYLLVKSGFKLIKSCNFMDLKSEISENSWNMFLVAKKI